jgi:endonuclease I
MNKLSNSILLLMLLLGFSVAEATYPTGYYDNLNGKNKAALKSAACDVIYNHTIIDYGTATWNAFKTTDARTIDGVDYWWDMYSDNLVKISSGHGSLNIEHSVANSWWDGTKNAAYKDLHHLNPSDATANNRKSNYPLGIVNDVTWENGVTFVGKPDDSANYGGASYVYEPCDEYKGDFARVFMYMFTCYENMTWGTRFTWMYTQGQTYPMLKPWAYELLLKWNKQDPVSQKELDRNEAVYSIQGNRNPFIDFPDLAEYIWGDMTDELFYVDGDHSGSATKDPELTSPVDGHQLNFGTHSVGDDATLNLYVKGKNLKDDITLTLSGSDNFTLAKSTVTAAEANTGCDVAVSYSAAEAGSFEATVTLSSSEFDSVTVNLVGEATESPVLESLILNEPTNVTATSYTLTWEPLAVTPDYYMVSRTRIENDVLKTRKYMTSNPTYTFTDRNNMVAETCTVQYALNGVLSQVSNEVVLEAGSTGIVETVAEPIWIETTDQGLYVAYAPQEVSMAVYDVAGRLQANVAYLSSGDVIALPQGIYILRFSNNATPQKVFVR